MLYRIEVPIPDYDNANVFMKNIFIESETCPTKQQLYEIVNTQHNEDLQYEEYIGEWLEVLETIKKITSFPRLSSNQVYESGFVELPKFGKRPFSIEKITPFKL